MAKDKNSIILYTDLIHTLRMLTDVQRGQLMLIIFEYVNDLNPDVKDPILKIVFEPIKQQLKRDLKKYEGKKKQWSNAGKASAEARRNKKERMLTDVNKRKQTPTVSTVNVNDSVNVSVNVNEEIKECIFEDFWNKYHLITNQSKTDREPALKYWEKLSNSEKQKAIDNIQIYYDNIKDYGKGKMPKKARTYLSDKNFNDEYSNRQSSTIPKKHQSYTDLLIPMPK